MAAGWAQERSLSGSTDGGAALNTHRLSAQLPRSTPAVEPPAVAIPVVTTPVVATPLISAFAVVALAIAIAVGCSSNPSSQRGDNDEGLSSTAEVDRVIDGDTILVKSHGERETVRLVGINTPESVHPTKPVECYGKEASAHTSALLPRGTPVLLRRDVEPRDRYGRLLAYVFRASDSLFVNLELVADGYARAYRFPPNVALSSEFAQAQYRARDQGMGLWSKCPE